MKRILVLFPKEWDRLEFGRRGYRDRYEFVYAGFDLFRFPSNVQLATFDVFGFVNRLLERFRHERLDGVFSNNEYFGALIAAVVAEKLGLPGTDPRVVITAQHKFYAAPGVCAHRAGGRRTRRRVSLRPAPARGPAVRAAVLRQARARHLLGPRAAHRPVRGAAPAPELLAVREVGDQAHRQAVQRPHALVHGFRAGRAPHDRRGGRCPACRSTSTATRTTGACTCSASSTRTCTRAPAPSAASSTPRACRARCARA